MLLPGSPPVAVEYDGAYWHQSALRRDQNKTADLIASGHLVIRIREEPLSQITPNDVVCTPDQPAAEVAEQVHQKILELAGPAHHRPDNEPDRATGEQLGLFDDSIGTGKARNGDVDLGALRALVGEGLLNVHRGSVESHLALARYLVDGAPLEALCAQIHRELGGGQAYLSMARRLIDGV